MSALIGDSPSSELTFPVAAAVVDVAPETGLPHRYAACFPGNARTA